MSWSYPDWFMVEKETSRIISRLSSIKELSFYLHNPDRFVRRLAIIQIGRLALKDGIGCLAEVVENHDEDLTNREFAAWAIKAISVSQSENIYLNNRLLTHYTGQERLEQVSGQVLIHDPGHNIEIEFRTPEHIKEMLSGHFAESHKDFIIEDSFSWETWFYSLTSAFKKQILNAFTIIQDVPARLFKKLIDLKHRFFKNLVNMTRKIMPANKPPKNPNTILHSFNTKHRNTCLKMLSHIQAGFIKKLVSGTKFLGQKLLLVSRYPFFFIRSHKLVSVFLLVPLTVLTLNIPWVGNAFEKHTNISVAEVNQIVYNIPAHFLTMVSEGASDLLNTSDTDYSYNITTDNHQTREKAFIVTAKNGLSLRSKPSALNSKIVEVMGYQTKAQFLNSHKTDGQGIVWYKLQTPSGKTGWANSKWLKEWR